jgi:hypothetical protein
MSSTQTPLTLVCGLAMLLVAQAACLSQAVPSLDWDKTFIDRSGTQPVHFVATYTDARGPHRLEEWRTGNQHLRRLTDNRIDLHADLATPPSSVSAEYTWQIIDLPHKVVNRISTAAMLQAGMMYNFYSMAHVISRPAGNFRLTAVQNDPINIASLTCTWFEINQNAQPAQRICWSSAIGAPLATRSQQPDKTWTTNFTLQSIQRNPIPRTVYEVSSKGLRIRNLDNLQTED